MATIVTRAGKGSPLTSSEVDSNFTNLNTDKAELSGAAFTGAITTNSTVDGRDVATDGTKLDTVETSADVTDTTNVTAAGALMDSELTSIASVKALNQGVATTDSPTFAAATVTGEITANGGIALGDNDKATFGAGDDLEIYHDGTDSRIDEVGGNRLILRSSDDIRMDKYTGENMGVFNADGSVDLYYDAVKKFETTSTGIDVTGTATMDGLTVDGAGSIGLVATDRLYMATSDGLGIQLDKDNNRIVPVGADGSTYNNNVSLGSSGLEFKNLFLSGTATMNGLVSSGDITLEFAGVNSDPAGARYLTFDNTDTTLVSGQPLGGVNWEAHETYTGINASIRAYAAGNGGEAELRIYTGQETEAMRITSAGNVGIGTSSPSANLEITQSGNNVGLLVAGGGYNYTAKFESLDAEANIIIEDSNSTNNGNMIGVVTNDMYFITNTSERMRIDSSGNVTVKASGADQARTLSLQGTNGASETYQFNLVADGEIAAAKFMVGVGGGSATERMRIDASGNVLVGTTSAGYGGVDLTVGDTTDAQNGVAIQTSTTGYGYLLFGDGSGAAAYRGQINYKHGDDFMAFNTAGAERMRIDSAGNVGIGTSSPAAKTHIVGAANAIALKVANSAVDGNNADVVHIEPSNAAYYGKLLRIQSGRSDFSDSLLFLNTTAGMNGTNGSYMRVQNNAGADIFRIKGDGNVGIGRTDPKGPLHVYGSNYAYMGPNVAGVTPDATTGGIAMGWNKSNGQGESIIAFNKGLGATGGLVFADNNGGTYAERMRIDSSGNLLVGTTSATGASASGVAISPTTSGGFISLAHPSGAATGRSYAVFRYNSGIIGNIAQSGTTGVLYNTSSDQRLKENIADADDAGSKIDAIQVRKYDWKADGSHQDYGMIAQELVEVAPEAVSVPEDSEEMMGVDYSKLVPMMLKEIQSLRNRVAQLETGE